MLNLKGVDKLKQEYNQPSGGFYVVTFPLDWQNIVQVGVNKQIIQNQ
ncbi:hypothetical protein PN488_20715 [Nodularia spumigena CS-591/12]|nr:MULTISPECIES: hypothetical protein [Cyanophyceae]MDB9366107.1 hypothetical protein [Nodularia spumigena CS-588/02A10]MDB9501423.1 hypothetical protein [Nodularia spumigena CS-336/02]MDB9533986.1 hypothetical protein [Nodularia spumigena CS-1038]MDB9306759.1 hypothetical protein [Nodularia spumigena CS-591/12]MDB9324446.1 hypothetical protein [Nodularia spumigena CS-591/07A]